MTRPTFVICEDGHEYTDRFTRLFADRYDFIRTTCFAEAHAAAPSAVGLLLDLDFRRTPSAALVDESGATSDARSEGERRRLASTQGILILRALRDAGVALPALLFADLADRSQVTFLESRHAPLTIVSSSAALVTISTALSTIATAPR